MLKLKIPIFLGFFLFIAFGAAKASASVDLSITSITVSPASPAFNEPCTITVTAVNLGDAVYQGTVGINNIQANITDFSISKITLPALSSYAPNASFTYVYNGTFNTTGSKNVGFLLDDGNQLSESKEDNNFLSIKTEVTERYDLFTESVVASPLHPAVGQGVTLTVLVKNNGIANLRDGTGLSDAAYDFSSFQIDKTIASTASVLNQIKFGEYVKYVYKGKFLKSGEQKLEFKADPNGQLAEKDENNNSFSGKITVVEIGKADVEFSSLAIDKAKPLVNETVTITATFKNTGQCSLTDDSGWLIADNNRVYPPAKKDILIELADLKGFNAITPVYPSALFPLEPGSSLTYSFTGYYSAEGDKTFGLRFNDNKRLLESDWENNEKKISFSVYKDASARDQFGIENFRIEPISTSSVRVKWETSEDAATSLKYKRYDQASYTEVSDEFGKIHSLDVEGLKQDNFYDFQVQATVGTVTVKSESIKYMMPPSANLRLDFGPKAYETATSGKYEFDFTTNFISKGVLYLRQAGSGTFKDYAIGEDLDHKLIINPIEPGDYEYYLDLATLAGVKLVSQTYAFQYRNNLKTQTATGTADVLPAKTDTAGVSEQTKATVSDRIAVRVEKIKDGKLYASLKGKIVLTVEANGEAYYIHPQKMERYYLGRPADAFAVMRDLGLGMTDANLKKIPLGLSKANGLDTDKDGLPDMFEDAIGTDKGRKDSDGDGFDDLAELTSSHSPVGPGKSAYDLKFAQSQKGKIILQVEGKGEAWYVSPKDGKRYFLGRPDDAFSVMREQGVGISAKDFARL